MSNNMRIWDAVCKTDPSHTKPVSFGRKFTAIDAQYQIQSATKLWGPIGQGWGFEAKHSTEHMGSISIAISDVTIWWQEKNQRHETGPVRASNVILNAKGHIDEDAWKKATTDALTKLLSYHGFNADVFLGRFDDNRYVQSRREEENRSMQNESYESMQKLKARIDQIDNLPHHKNWGMKHKPEIERLLPSHQQEIRDHYKSKRHALIEQWKNEQSMRMQAPPEQQGGGLQPIGDAFTDGMDVTSSSVENG